MASKCLSRTECGLAVRPVFITDPSVGFGPGLLCEPQPLGGVVPRVRWQTCCRLPRNKMADMRNEGARWAIRGTSWDRYDMFTPIYPRQPRCTLTRQYTNKDMHSINSRLEVQSRGQLRHYFLYPCPKVHVLSRSLQLDVFRRNKR